MQPQLALTPAQPAGSTNESLVTRMEIDGEESFPSIDGVTGINPIITPLKPVDGSSNLAQAAQLNALLEQQEQHDIKNLSAATAVTTVSVDPTTPASDPSSSSSSSKSDPLGENLPEQTEPTPSWVLNESCELIPPMLCHLLEVHNRNRNMTQSSVNALARVANGLAHYILCSSPGYPNCNGDRSIMLHAPISFMTEVLQRINKHREKVMLVDASQLVERWCHDYTARFPDAHLALSTDSKNKLARFVLCFVWEVLEGALEVASESNSVLVRPFDLYRAMRHDECMRYLTTFIGVPFSRERSYMHEEHSLTSPQPVPSAHEPFPLDTPWQRMLASTFQPNREKLQQINASQWYFNPEKVKRYAALYAKGELLPGDEYFFRQRNIRPIAFYGTRRYPFRGDTGPANDMFAFLGKIDAQLLCRMFSFELRDDHGKTWTFLAEVCGLDGSSRRPDGWVRCDMGGVAVGFVDATAKSRGVVRCLDTNAWCAELIRKFQVEDGQVTQEKLQARTREIQREADSKKRCLALLAELSKEMKEAKALKTIKKGTDDDIAFPELFRSEDMESRSKSEVHASAEVDENSDDESSTEDDSDDSSSDESDDEKPSSLNASPPAVILSASPSPTEPSSSAAAATSSSTSGSTQPLPRESHSKRKRTESEAESEDRSTNEGSENQKKQKLDSDSSVGSVIAASSSIAPSSCAAAMASASPSVAADAAMALESTKASHRNKLTLFTSEAYHNSTLTRKGIRHMLRKMRTFRESMTDDATKLTIESRWSTALQLIDYARFEPQMWSANHPPAVCALFTAQLVQEKMKEANLPPLPDVLAQLIGEYEPAVLPYVKDEEEPIFTSVEEASDSHSATTPSTPPRKSPSPSDAAAASSSSVQAPSSPVGGSKSMLPSSVLRLSLLKNILMDEPALVKTLPKEKINFSSHYIH